MHFIVIKDSIQKQYYVLKTPYLPEFYSILKRKNTMRYKLKVFENNYTQRLFKIFYIKYLISKKYRYRRKLLNDFLSEAD